MPFRLEHVLFSDRIDFETHTAGNATWFTVERTGTFHVLHVGTLVRTVEATVRRSERAPTTPNGPTEPPGGPGDPGGGPRPGRPGVPGPLHGGVNVDRETIPVRLEIVDPDGVPFTRNDVTREDLKRYRDLRGASRPWTFRLSGKSRVYQLHAAIHEVVSDPRGTLALHLAEDVPSASAGPIFRDAPVVAGAQRFPFHMNRVGTFVASVLPPVPGTIRLLDHRGQVVGSTTESTLRARVTLAALGTGGPATPWTLEVETAGPLPAGVQPTVNASVLGEGRIGVGPLDERIKKLLGSGGDKIQIHGETEDGTLRLVMKISDPVVAETLDMHGLIDARLRFINAELGTVEVEPIVLVERSNEVADGVTVDVSSMRLTNVTFAFGRSKYLGAHVPSVRITLSMSGHAMVSWQKLIFGGTLGALRLHDGHGEIELGMGVDPDGTPRLLLGMPEKFVRINLTGPLDEMAPGSLTSIENKLNEAVRKGLARLFRDPTIAPRILMTLFGAHLRHLEPRFEGDDILFEHIAPAEPQRSHRFTYRGAIGRAVTYDNRGRAVFDPPTLGDTWAADNLRSKIKHIVVVMMENRSYDHVLGYRAQAPTLDGKDGLTPAIMDAVNRAILPDPAAPRPGEAASDAPLPPMHPLRLSAFPLTPGIGRRTRIPVGVGHELANVTEQLSVQLDGPDGRKLNHPTGFVADFQREKLNGRPEHDHDTVPFDVLGYYEANRGVLDPNQSPPQPVDDLPMYTFLADHYAYSDRYFCSYAGPTLPNRMYSLTGDVQRDRHGEPILDNNHSDNFLLARETTIFDVLQRHGVSFRVYESQPSVTMLRMFARYATDDVHIRPLDELARDCAAGELPSVVVIEPAMHHYPEDDDHPDADMWRGQMFIRRVYEALRSSPGWKDTLFLITYDEHGGLYDHVVPPLADVIQPRSVVASEEETGALPHRPAADATPPVANAGLGFAVASFQPLAVNALEVNVNSRWHGNGLAMPGLPATPEPTVLVPYGVRVPTFVISPWVPADARPDLTLDHCSILKTILATFCHETRPFLGDRVNASHSFEAFVTADAPRLDVPPAPPITELRGDGAVKRTISSATGTCTLPVFRAQLRAGNVDFHELTGRLARMLGR